MIDSGAPDTMHSRARETPFLEGIADGDHGRRIATEVAHGSEARARHLEPVSEPDA